MISNDLINLLPPPWPEELTTTIRESLLASGRTIVVLDDDPTGTQTVYDVPVLTQFDEATLTEELKTGPPVLFLMTNSRSMTSQESASLHAQIINALKSAATAVGRSVEVISRSDSTLRGHFPLETDIIADLWPEQSELVLLMPFFLEGVRLTIQGQHYVGEGDQLTPAHETPFASDPVFGFAHSNMPDYVEEKTNGRIGAKDVVLIPIDVIREQGPGGVCEILNNAPAGSVCVADGVSDKDAQVVSLAVGQCTRTVLARVAASYVRARSGLAQKPLLSHDELSEGVHAGGLVVVGSHVPKTTAQLGALLKGKPECDSIELPVGEVLEDAEKIGAEISQRIDQSLESGNNAILFTSRDLVLGGDDADNLRISKAVSLALVSIVKQLSIRPKFLIAKGGITSSDIATEALQVRRAMVAGSILPGVPVWKLGPETRFPEMHYVIFPGNVGGDDALLSAVQKLSP
jgi:uncharacterized protein YgbK (DUF1537 family)